MIIEPMAALSAIIGGLLAQQALQRLLGTACGSSSL
ncbi:MAG: hypothetical protein ACI9RY_001306 [Reinekea sp.]|jgi:hypothetical protein